MGRELRLRKSREIADRYIATVRQAILRELKGAYQKMAGWRGIGLSLGPSLEAFDAELISIMMGLRILTQRGESGRSFTLFTDSQAAMRRVLGDPQNQDRRWRSRSSATRRDSEIRETRSPSDGSRPTEESRETNRQTRERGGRHPPPLKNSDPEKEPCVPKDKNDRADHPNMAGRHKGESRWQRTL